MSYSEPRIKAPDCQRYHGPPFLEVVDLVTTAVKHLLFVSRVMICRYLLFVLVSLWMAVCLPLL